MNNIRMAREKKEMKGAFVVQFLVFMCRFVRPF